MTDRPRLPILRRLPVRRAGPVGIRFGLPSPRRLLLLAVAIAGSLAAAIVLRARLRSARDAAPAGAAPGAPGGTAPREAFAGAGASDSRLVSVAELTSEYTTDHAIADTDATPDDAVRAWADASADARGDAAR